MTFLWGAIGFFVGYLLNRLADHLTRFASSRPRPSAPAHSGTVPATLQMMAHLLSTRGRHFPRALVSNAAVELTAAFLFSCLWSRFGLSWNYLLVVLIGSFLLLIAIIDLRYRLILNVLVLPATGVTLLLNLTLRELNFSSVLLGGGFGLAVFAFAAFVRPGELGAGDVKLATLIGLMFGFPNAIMPLLAGVLAGGLAALFLVVTRRGNRSTQIPYAPFLCLGALLALLYVPFSSFSFQR